MKCIGKVALILLLLVAVITHTGLAQTRPRRAEQSRGTSAPAPAAVNGEPEPQDKTAEQPPFGAKAKAEDVDVVRIDTTLVTLPVSVTDRLGRYIPDLHRQDFRIYEEGTEQEIAYFAAVDKPFTVVLMIDTSASNWSKLGQIRAASRVFVEQLRPDDQVMVVSFASGLSIECEATSDRQKIGKAIEKTGKGMSTHLYDAMDQLMRKHLDRIAGRKAVVLFTDGVDATSKHATYQSTLRIAEELDALIYPIRYDTYDPASDTGGSIVHRPSIFGIPLPLPTIGSGGGGGAGTSRADYARGERYLHELAELTSGRAYEASSDLRYLRDAFSHIAEELRRQYSLGYYPKQTAQVGQRRRVKVRVNRSDLAVRTRDSYIFKGNSSQPAAPSITAASEPGSSPTPVLQKKPLVREF